MPKNKGDGKLQKLLDDFPALQTIRFEASRCGAKTRKRWFPKTSIRVQVADPASMHLVANNVDLSGRRYMVRPDNRLLRGTKEQYMVAVDVDDGILAKLKWYGSEGLLPEKMSKDIFTRVDATRVHALVWVTLMHWYTIPPKEKEEETGRLFDKYVSSELDMIVFRKPKKISFTQLIEIADKEKKERDEAYKYLPKDMPELVGVHKALRDGCRLHAFSSGGGLRVVGISKGKREVAYGEHPHVEEALRHADEDYFAGGRPYSEVYGKKYPHYLTGDTVSTSNVDYWLRSGNKFDCWFDGDHFTFELEGYSHTETPKNVLDELKGRGFDEDVLWTNRGYIYRSYKSKFPSGEPCISTEVVKHVSGDIKSGADPWMYQIKKTGTGATLWEAMRAAFEAPEIEYKEK